LLFLHNIYQLKAHTFFWCLEITVESNRTLGVIGASLTAIGAIGQVSTILQYAFPISVTHLALGFAGSATGVFSFIGFILFLVAMHGLSRDYNEHGIFNNTLYGIIAAIVAAVVAGIVTVVLVVLNFLTTIPDLNPTNTMAYASSTVADPASIASSYISLLLVAVSLASVLLAVFYMRAFNLLSAKSNVPLFKTAGKVLLAGASISSLLGIIFVALMFNSISSTAEVSTVIAVGTLVQDSAWAMLAVAFLRIRPPPQTQPTPFIVAPVVEQVKYCPYCGAQNVQAAQYCAQCGKKL
jgi:uncharacterized membrane protein